MCIFTSTIFLQEVCHNYIHPLEVANKKTPWLLLRKTFHKKQKFAPILSTSSRLISHYGELRRAHVTSSITLIFWSECIKYNNKINKKNIFCDKSRIHNNGLFISIVGFWFQQIVQCSAENGFLEISVSVTESNDWVKEYNLMLERFQSTYVGY